MKSVVQVLSFDLASKVILGVLGILLIRYMPASDYAEYTLALALTAFVSQSVAATFNRIYIISSPKGHGEEWSLIGAQGLTIGLLILLGMPLIHELGQAYWLVAALVLASCMSEFAKTYYQRDLKFMRFSMVELFRSAFFFLAALGLIAASGQQPSSEGMIAVQTASLMLVAWLALFRQAPNWPSTSFSAVRERLSRIVKGDYSLLFGYFFVLGIFTQTDIFMLKIVGDEAMLATYGSAFRYYSILSLALGAVHTVLLPTIQRLSNHEELRQVLKLHRRVLIAFAAVVVVVGWLGAWVIPWIDAGKYPSAVVTFRVLCASAIVSFAFSPHVNLLMRFERFKFLLGLILAALATHIVVSATLIPMHGALGAAISMSISTAIVTVSIYLKSRKLIASNLASGSIQP